jgi:hypothetical protein
MKMLAGLAVAGHKGGALYKLMPIILPRIDIARAQLRGRYMRAVSKMEWAGVHIDTTTLTTLREVWPNIQDALITDIDQHYGVYEGRTFKRNKFEALLGHWDLPWPRYPTGSLMLDDDTFRDMAKMYPHLGKLRELRSSLSRLRLNTLTIGRDGYNRCLLSPFQTKTGRNAPSNSEFIFGPSTWIRHLIQPPPGRAIAYLDFEQQEFGIAAALSGDAAMIDAYRSGDPYLAFAKQAGAVPQSATKQSHKDIRDQFKQCALGVQYGMGELSLATRLNTVPVVARELLALHRRTYRRYWEWSDGVQDYVALGGRLHTVYGWHLQPNGDFNPRSVRNFPIQGNGAEMLRLACCFATEAGVQVSAPVHDALLIESPQNGIEEAIAKCAGAMRRASEYVLTGFPIHTESKLIIHPQRYSDTREGCVEFWQTVCRLGGLPTSM